MSSDVSNPDHWNERYENDHTPWDLGGPAHALTELLPRLGPGQRQVLVPGAGTGHDAISWAGAGHRVVAVDFAPRAVDSIRDNAHRQGVAVEAVQADIFDLPAQFNGRFDSIWEQTCLCALDPSRRDDYVDAMWRCVRPDGTLYALLWNHGREGGPPYDLPREPTIALLSRRFRLTDEQRVTGSSRQGEYLLTLVRED